MHTMTNQHAIPEIFGGVDTHALTHHAAVVDAVGRELADREFPATPAGYKALRKWMTSFGRLASVGVEGTGSYGAGLNRGLGHCWHCGGRGRPSRPLRAAIPGQV